MLLTTASEGTGPARVLVVGVVVTGILYGLFRVLSIGRRGRRLPPGSFCACGVQGPLLYADIEMSSGPPTVPILGNEHQIPAADGHFLYVVTFAFFFSFFFPVLIFLSFCVFLSSSNFSGSRSSRLRG